MVVLVVGELLDGVVPAVAAERPIGEGIKPPREEEESRGRDRRPVGWVGEWDKEDAQPATQAAAHATVGWLSLLLRRWRRGHGQRRRGREAREATPASGKGERRRRRAPLSSSSA